MGALSRGPKGRLWGASAAALLCLSLSLAASIRPAEADKVGVAAAVNPDAFSSLSGSPQSQLNIGKSIFFNERINTTTSGLVQVLLVDGSTFTVGPGSDLVIDKFIYDPKKQSGQVVASFSKGVMRFVGGKISKNDQGVTIKTPAGALAIRGGMAQGNGKVWSFLYGVSMTLTGKSGKTYTVYEPGYTLDLTGGTPTIRPTRPEDINVVMAALTNGSANGLGSTPDQNAPLNPADTQGLNQTESDIVNDATQTQIQDTVQDQQNQPQQTGNNNTPPPPPCTGDACNPQEPPTPITLRVVAAPSSYTAYGQSIADPLQHGILGGDDNPNVTVDDFLKTLQLQNGRLTGTIEGLRDGCTGDGCAEDGTKPNIPAKVNLPWTFPDNQCATPGVCLVSDATVQQGTEEPTTYFGTAVHKPGFFAYHLAAVDSTNPNDVHVADHVLLFGGETYQFTQPSGTVYRFDLVPDVLQSGAAPPFASLESMPLNGDTAAITPLVMLEDGDQTVWLQTSFYLQRNEDGTLATGDQDSFINIALGGMSENGGLVGMRRGGSHVALTPPCEGAECASQRQSLAFTGDITTLAGPDGSSHFMGTQNPNIIIGFDSTEENHNIGRDIPLDPIAGFNDNVENQSGATYHIGVGTGTLAVGPQSDGAFKGYAAGLAEQAGGGTPAILVNTSPNNVTVSLDAATNTMAATLNLGDGILQNPKYHLEFGGEGRSAFIGDNTFAAIEAESGSTVSQQYVVSKRTFPFFEVRTDVDDHPDVQSYMASADAINANAVLFGTNADTHEPNKTAFCNQCAFMKWGAWGTRISYENHAGQDVTKDVQLGWWIAGDVVSNSDIPTDKNKTASYAGDVIGNVNNNGQQYVATGGLDMFWNFGNRSGTLAINKFDTSVNNGQGLDFFGPIARVPGSESSPNRFAGVLGGSGVIGAANGSFVGSTGRGTTPQGVIGNFGVTGNHYQATGIFGGALKP